VGRAGRLLATAASAILVVFLAGFVVFAARIANYAPALDDRADAIVALTGGEHRLLEAARLLAEGRGSRLLVSGVNRITTREDLKRKSGLSDKQFERVDIGYAAHDTSGNAEETKRWAAERRFTRLIIVTSSYHMPRSLIELGRAMPGVALLPHPVVSPKLKTERWWLHATTARLYFTEYLKFLPSAARYGMARLLRWENSAFAGDAASRAASR
jgi:uncharacterized SAM-binding protein YcdF (DUF218 family)